MRKRFFSIIVCVVMLFTMNVTAFAAETQENYSETEKTMTFEITPTALTSGSSRHSVGMLNSFFGTNDTVATSALGSFPISHLLDFVEEQINLAADFFCSAKDFIMQCNSRTKVCIAHVLKIQGNKLFWLDPVLGKFLLDQAQHDRFSTTANPCQNLYQLISDKRTDTAHINFSFNHVDQPPF